MQSNQSCISYSIFRWCVEFWYPNLNSTWAPTVCHKLGQIQPETRIQVQWVWFRYEGCVPISVAPSELWRLKQKQKQRGNLRARARESLQGKNNPTSFVSYIPVMNPHTGTPHKQSWWYKNGLRCKRFTTPVLHDLTAVCRGLWWTSLPCMVYFPPHISMAPHVVKTEYFWIVI